MDAATFALLRLAGVYVALITLMGVALTYLVILYRRSKLIGLGDGGDKTMARRVRIHGNFCENAPFALALLIALALLGRSALVIHAVGFLFLAGRGLHAWGLSQSAGTSIGRVGGMVSTHTSFFIGAIALLLAGFGA
jgi:uncharacterized protein